MKVAAVALCLLALPAWAGDTVERTPLETIVPVYPEKARRERLEGEVQVCFYVTREGEPYRIAVRKSTHRIFEKPARRAVRESRFVPLKEDEQHSGIKSCRTFTFTLDAVETETSSDATNLPNQD